MVKIMPHYLPYIFVTRPYLPDRTEFNRYLDKIWEVDILTNQGPLHQEFERKLSEIIGDGYVTLTVNGHMALDIAIKALCINGDRERKRREVITTPFTFASTVHALIMNDLQPVFCDICASDLTIDAEKIEDLITPETTAIMPVHVYGHPCDMERIQKIADKHDLKVIYDAAHAFYETVSGVNIGLFGDASIFSFHATKLFHSIEGGAVVYRSKGQKRLLDAYKNFGIESEEEINFVGENAKMNEFQAAMGLTVLPHLHELIDERKSITEKYHENLSCLNGVRLLSDVRKPNVRYNYAYMPVLIDEREFGISRDCLCEFLKKQNIFTRKYFYPLVSDYKCYAGRFDSSKTPIAAGVAKRVLCLPIYVGLELRQVDMICDLIEKARFA
jgi:dTDP-4-amino-4,6-dideoxygalactose transaminase